MAAWKPGDKVFRGGWRGHLCQMLPVAQERREMRTDHGIPQRWRSLWTLISAAFEV